MTETSIRAQIVVPELPKPLEGEIVQANPQQVTIRLDSLDSVELLKPDQSLLVWVVSAKGIYQVSAVFIERQEELVQMQFRKAKLSERRNTPRYPCQMMIELKAISRNDDPDLWEKAVATDIGHGGLNIASQTRYLPDTQLEVRFWLVGRDIPIHSLARVKHCHTVASNRHLIGLAFENLSRLDLALLQRMFP